MRTKTLLIAAAALVAGIVSSEAQVYSANVVGYVSIPLTNGVIALIAPALDKDGTGTNNTVSSLFTNPSIGDGIYVFNGIGYDFLSYSIVGSGHPVVNQTNWFNGATIATNYPINPGESVFYLAASNETATIVGTVLQGTLVNQYFPTAGKIQLLSSQAPITGGLTSVLGYKPSIGDGVYIYGNGSYNYYSYSIVGTGHPVVNTTNWFNGATPGEPVISVGQGFWLQPVNNTNWVENFIVQ